MKKAVALTYQKDLPAPFLLARGKNELAGRLCRIAEDHCITIMKDDELVESLFTLDVGSFIPEDLFEVVAELLAFVYRLDYGEQSMKQDFI
ncbi:MAG: EscU/YscU/HrcU family type III secretion system export apparatus switch protein [Spirochaetales bacterium]|nr:EscU/YscU/HrcU family type III secretion system export apparatus switch protein [Spirochaetales bacterium]